MRKIGLIAFAIATLLGSISQVAAQSSPLSPNQVWAGPPSGSSPAFPVGRALVGADLPLPTASTLGGVESIASVSHNFLTSIDTSGVPHQAQPAWSDLSGSQPAPGSNSDVMFNASNLLSGDSGFTYVGSGQATLALGTITTNRQALSISATWNLLATTFDAPLFMNITNTLYAPGSRLFDFQMGGVSVFHIGDATAGDAAIVDHDIANNQGFTLSWSGLSFTDNAVFTDHNVTQFFHNSTLELDFNGTGSNIWTFVGGIRLGVDVANRGIIATSIIQEIGGSSSNAFFHQNSDGAAAVVMGASANYAQIGKVSTHVYGLCWSATLSNVIGTCPVEWTDNGAALITNNAITIGGVVFASLPAAVAGDDAYITDGKASNCGDTTCTTWGTTVTAGAGALKLHIWYNGANWTLIGK